MSDGSRQLLITALTAVFVTSLVSAQLLSSKLAVLSLPVVGVVSLPVAGAVTYPAGTLAYAGTFFATDVTGEVFGKATARRIVNVGFAMNVLMLAFAGLAVVVPVAETSVPQSAFAAVIGSSLNVVVGSLVAYLVSQNWDVLVFHRLREATGGRWLWTRNVGSTGTSQLVDTVLFTTVAYWLAPSVLGGLKLPAAALAGAVVGQYVLKILIALVDTPLVYAAVGYLRSKTSIPAGAEPA